jgi:hypothetical protein
MDEPCTPRKEDSDESEAHRKITTPYEFIKALRVCFLCLTYSPRIWKFAYRHQNLKDFAGFVEHQHDRAVRTKMMEQICILTEESMLYWFPCQDLSAPSGGCGISGHGEDKLSDKEVADLCMETLDWARDFMNSSNRER